MGGTRNVDADRLLAHGAAAGPGGGERG